MEPDGRPEPISSLAAVHLESVFAGVRDDDPVLLVHLHADRPLEDPLLDFGGYVT